MTPVHPTDAGASPMNRQTLSCSFKWQPREVYDKLGNQLRGEGRLLDTSVFSPGRVKGCSPRRATAPSGRAASLPRRRASGTPVSHEHARHADRHRDRRTEFDYPADYQDLRRRPRRGQRGVPSAQLSSRRATSRRSPQEQPRTRTLRVSTVFHDLGRLGGVFRMLLREFFSRGRSVFEERALNKCGSIAGRGGYEGADEDSQRSASSSLLLCTVDSHTHTRQTRDTIVAVLSTPTVSRYVSGGDVDV